MGIYSIMLKKNYLHSLLFFAIILILNFIVINDFAVMGVKNDSITEIVKNEFLWTIIWAFVSQFSSYFIIAFLAAIFFNVFYHAYPTKVTIKHIYLFLAVFQFSIVMYYATITPQYFNEFIDNIGFLGHAFHFLIFYVHPYIYTIIMLSYLLFFFHCLYRIYDLQMMSSVAIIFLCFYAAYHHVKDSNTEDKRLNVLFLSADSFRSDMLDSLKLLERLESIGELERIENMYTAIPRTFPAWASTFTGLYPSAHSVYNMFPQKVHRSDLYEFSLVNQLRENGYHTEIISDFAGDIFSRMDLGFNNVRTPYFNFNTIIKQRILEVQVFLLPYLFNDVGYRLYPYLLGFAKFPNAKRLTNQTIKSIRESKEPFFITTFYSDLHFPYSARFPNYKGDPDYSGSFRYMKNQTLDGKSVTEEDKKQIQNLFWGSAKTIKSEFNKILDHLIKSGKIKNTVIVFSSDHGENVYEHKNIMGHGDHLYDINTIKIPFLLFTPKKLKKVQHNRVHSNIDIMPSIFDLLDQKINLPINGKSIFSNDSNEFRFIETGLWFVNNNNEFYQNERIIYPDVTEIVEIEWANNNEPAIKSDYLTITEKAKHRAIVYKDYRLLYIPLENEIIWKLFNKDAEIDLEDNLELVKKLKQKFYDHYSPFFDIEDGYLYLKQ
jgi:hypothetical protein